MIPSERSKSLLKQLDSKELVLTEFLSECAYWAVKEGFDELKPRVLPTKPPRALEMEVKYFGREDAADWNKIYQEYPEVKGYHEQKLFVEHWNVSTKKWLKEMLGYIPEGDFPTRDKINDRLKMFVEVKDELLEKAKKTFEAQ